MSKGITAFVIVLSLTLSISMLVGVGYADELFINVDDSNLDDDADAALEAFTDQDASSEGGSVFTEFTVGAGDTLQAAWQVLSNLGGILKLLFGLPGTITEPIEKLFQITFGITFAAFIRGLRLQ